jgi:DNA-binding NarL/FixJ family response regulator
MRAPLYKLLLIDSDFVFRLGLRTWLNQFTDLDIAAETDTTEQAWHILAGDTTTKHTETSIRDRPTVDIDLVILGLSVSQNDQVRGAELEFCRQLKSRYPSLPILVLSSVQDTTWGAIAFHSGVEGYCFKGAASEELVIAIRQVASGQTYLGDRPLIGPNSMAVNPNGTLSVLDLVKHNMHQASLRQIESDLAEIQAQLANTGTSTADLIAKAVLAGRMRELTAARWLAERMWGTRRIQPPTPLNYPWTASLENTTRLAQRDQGNQSLVARDSSEQRLVNARAIQLSLIDATVTKLQDNLSNLTPTPLEIDILNDEKRRELLYSILRQLENILVELQFSQIQLPQLLEQKSIILRDLWQNALTKFVGKYYTLTVNSTEINVVEVLLQDTAIIESTILAKIPQVTEFLSHLLFQTALKIDNHTYDFGTPDAMERLGLLLDHLLIQIANAVIQPLLNHFADVEEVKQRFFAERMMASREIERFRNDLSWKYRLERYFVEPQTIFESRYILWTLASPGIKKITIYAPRTQELQQLQGLPLLVTLALELQDAIIPRLHSILSILGSGVVYVLTNVIGRGIGLIGRGILQGMGSAWQEGRVQQKQRSL